jgi:hypothetical protein
MAATAAAITNDKMGMTTRPIQAIGAVRDMA